MVLIYNDSTIARKHDIIVYINVQYNHQIVQSCNLAIMQSYNCAVEQPRSQAIVQSCLHAFVQSYIWDLPLIIDTIH